MRHEHRRHDEGHRPPPPPPEECGCDECSGSRNDAQSAEFMIRTWQHAFERAAHEVQVEILKERIRKAWGSSLNSIADSVIDLMMKDWARSQGREKAGEEREKAWDALVEKIAAAYNKGPK